MRYILALAFGVICLTALLGSVLSLFGHNYIEGCFGARRTIPTFLFTYLGGVILTYTIWSNRKNLSIDGKPTKLAAATFLFGPVVCLFLQGAIPMTSQAGFNQDLTNWLLYIIMLIFFVSIGNYVTTTRRDSFGGIRNRWTLSSRTVWANTQRLHGHFLVFGGLSTLALVPFSSVGTAMTAMLVVYPLSICMATIYSAYTWFSMEPAL